MQTMTPAAEIVAHAKQHTQMNAKQLLHTLSFVPDDRLTWSPAATSKSALRLVAHCAVSNESIAKCIRGEASPADASAAEMFRQIEQAEAQITSRENAIQALESSTQVVLEALDSVTDARVNGTSDSPFGEFPMMFWMFLPGNHMMGHGCQIDYLQTIWGDMEFHFAGP